MYMRNADDLAVTGNAAAPAMARRETVSAPAPGARLRRGSPPPEFVSIGAPPPPPDAALAANRLNHPLPPTAEIPANDRAPHSEPTPGPARRTLSEHLAAVDLFSAIAWVRERWRIVTLCTILGILAAGLFAITAQPRYTTYVDMFVDPSDVQVLSDEIFVQSPLQDALLLSVESKMRYLTSTSVLRDVVQRLDLGSDPEFVGEPAGLALLAARLPLIGGLFDAPADLAQAELVALRELYERVAAQREERSFVVTLSVWARTPDKAVTIAEAITASFQDQLSEADAQRASSAGDALNARLAELRANLVTAETAVETFRRDNDLLATSGELVSSQSLTQLNANLLDAQARVIQAQARYDELSNLDANGLDAADVIESEVLSELRAQYAILRQEIDSQSAIFGPRHPNIAQLTPQLAGISEEIDREIARRVQAAGSELQEAEMVAARLANDIARARGTVSTDNAAQVRLRELEREAAAQAAIYEAFLVRAGEITQREQIDTTNVRVMSNAVPPRERSFPPRTVVLLALGAIAGLMAGLGLAVLLGFARTVWAPRPAAGGPAPATPGGVRAAA